MPAARRATGFVDLRRLALTLPVFAAIAAGVVLPSPGSREQGVGQAVLLETPPTQAASGIGLDPDQLAPNFEVSGLDGARIRLAELRGRPVLINFWATWCTSCLSEMPVIRQVQEERGPDVFTVLAINAGETRKRAKEFIDFLDAPFIYGFDGDLTVADAYGVYGLPLSVFIDSEGVVQAVYRGHAERQRFETLLDAAITAKPPGELPPVIRLITTIPRERTITVTAVGKDRLHMSSRAFRCDASFCADEIAGEIRSLLGVRAAAVQGAVASGGLLVVDFDPLLVSSSQLVEGVVGITASLADPLYDGEVVVQYAKQ